MTAAEDGRLLAPGEAAGMLGVNRRTLRDWERRGLVSCARTGGGHRRYPEAEIEALAARGGPPGGRAMTPPEVAALFRVHPRTVTRWAREGRMRSFATPGGHRRFRESEVRERLRGGLREAA